MPEMERVSARVLVVSPDRRALLLRLEPGFRTPFWVTPGGGIEDGESLEDAALRELREEVGRALEIGPFLWTRDVVFDWEEWHVRQVEHTYLVRADEEFEAVVEHAHGEPIVASGWFDVAELRRHPETIYPDDLADRLAAVIRQHL